MINKILVYTISICILLGVLMFINRVIYYQHKPTLTTKKQTKLLPRIINNIAEKQFYWGNHEIIN
jgi:hypothetical protein